MNKDFDVYVRVNALISFSAKAPSLEEALKSKIPNFFKDGIEYVDGTETITGVLASNDE